MRGAAETSHVLLEYRARRLTAHIHELAAVVADGADSDGLLWALSADLAALSDVAGVLLDREAFSHQHHAGG